MTKYLENFIYTTSFIKKLINIKMGTLLLGHPVPCKIMQRRIEANMNGALNS